MPPVSTAKRAVDAAGACEDIGALMQILPSFDRFKALASVAALVPVWREFLFDVDTAVTAYSKLVEPPFGFLLESVVGGEQWARYSFLGTRPAGAWRLHRGVVSWWTPGSGWSAVDVDDPLDDLNDRLRARVPADVPGACPASGEGR